MNETPIPNAGPLSGYRVIDLSINVLGPVATQILGDMGADVIKVEPPEGDYTRHVGPARSDGMGVFFLNINRNKRSVVLDLKQKEARAALERLIATADVVIHSMRPGAAERLGIDYPTLAAQSPKIVYASAGGYRSNSSRRDWPAFDDVIQGLSGIAIMNEDDEGRPRYFPTVIADKFCGYVLASAVGMALLWRERTGQGQEVHVPMLETMASFNLTEHLWGASLDEPELGLGYPRMFSKNRKPYPTADGYICHLANTDEHWKRMFSAIGREDLIGDPRFARITNRGRNIDELYAIVSDCMKTRTTAEWRARLDAADIPNGPVNTFADLLADPYLNETGFFQHVTHPTEGKIMTLTPAVSFSQCNGAIRFLAPRLGAHTAEILTQAGVSEADIALLTGSKAA